MRCGEKYFIARAIYEVWREWDTSKPFSLPIIIDRVRLLLVAK